MQLHGYMSSQHSEVQEENITRIGYFCGGRIRNSIRISNQKKKEKISSQKRKKLLINRNISFIMINKYTNSSIIRGRYVILMNSTSIPHETNNHFNLTNQFLKRDDLLKD